LLGFDYEIEYKKDIDNKVIDALSRRDGHSCQFYPTSTELFSLSEIIPQWVCDIKLSYVDDGWIKGLQLKLNSPSTQNHHLTSHQGILRKKGRICVGGTSPWRQQLLRELHDSSIGGHSGATVTYHRMKQLFYWPNLKEDVLNYVMSCFNCQMTKPEHIPTPGLLHPLPIPVEAWTSIGLDFVTGLPKCDGKEVIMVMVDRLTKFAHFVALSHPYSAITIAKVFLDNIYKLHILPTSIISDRDPIFIN
jgi:Integrase zinc binding domain